MRLGNFLHMCLQVELGEGHRINRRSNQNHLEVTMAARKLVPLFDRILVSRLEAMTKTASGIVIPEKAQDKVLEGVVEAVGQGVRTEEGTFVKPVLKAGDKVLLPEFGGTKVTLDKKDYFLFRESEIPAKYD